MKQISSTERRGILSHAAPGKGRYWKMRNLKFLFAGFFLVIAGAAMAAAPEVVVVKVTRAPQFTTGDILDLSKPIKLPEGASLTLVDTSGRKIHLKGPYSGLLDTLGKGETSASGSSSQGKGFGLGNKINVVKSLARLFKSSAVDTSSLGAFRGVSKSLSMPEPWLIDVSQQGDYCVNKGNPVTLWRPSSGDNSVMLMQETASKATANIKWTRGVNQLDWPMEVPLNDGADYLVFSGGMAKSTKLTVHLVPEDLPTRIHKAAWMAENKCDKQATLLVVFSDIDKLIDQMAKEGKF